MHSLLNTGDKTSSKEVIHKF